MGLISYYKTLYSSINVLIRSDAKDLTEFYIRNLDNVQATYIDTDSGRYYGQIITNCNSTGVSYENGVVRIPTDHDIMFHAEHDKYREDTYKGIWDQPYRHPSTRHFSEMFYVFYNIDFLTRITHFTVERDLLLEEEVYTKFIETNGSDYVVYHDDENNSQYGEHHVSTKLDFDRSNKQYSYVNLNRASNIFFDYIKVFQNAKQIHLVDSIWGCLLYQLDARYGILQGKQVNLYCKRGHENLFKHPINLLNWNLIK
jgi:hypothetical protein